MNILECIWMALTSLSENKVRSFLTTLGVIIGVMSVILLVSLGEAAQAYIEKQFSGMGSNVILVTPGKQETTSSMIAVSAGSFRKRDDDANLHPKQRHHCPGDHRQGQQSSACRWRYFRRRALAGIGLGQHVNQMGFAESGDRSCYPAS